MNEQLIKIGLESGMLNYVDNETPRHYFLSGHADEQDLAKFAELIVRECAELAKKKAFIIMQKAEEYAADKEEMINATSAAFHLEILEQEIREHFGVEE